MNFKKIDIIILVILAIGLILRMWGINFGLPYQFHQDEPIVVNHALAYGTGDLNPHFFVIPPLTSYVLFIFYLLYFAAVNLCGICRGTEAFSLSFFSDPTPFYVIGRFAIGILPSILSVYLTYKLALRFFSKKAALYAALVMAVTFLNVIDAHYAYTDNLLVLFVILAYISMARLIDNQRRADYAITGFAVGLAVATKYNALLLIAPFLIAHIIGRGRDGRGSFFDIKVLIFAGVAAYTFVMFNPYSVFDACFFWESITHRIRGGYIGIGHHLTYSLFEGAGSIPVILGIVGLLVFVKKDLKKSIFLLSFPLLFYIHLVLKSQPFPRYVLPIIPFLAIGQAFLFFELYENMKTKMLRFVTVVIAVIVLIPTTVKSVKADALFAGKDTRIEAKAWIEKNIQPGEKIALAHTFFSPPLEQTIEQLKEKQDILSKQPELKNLKNRKLELLIKTYKPSMSYNIYYLKGGSEGSGQFLNFWPVVENTISDLKKNGIEYVVFNNMDTTEMIERLHKEVGSMSKPIAIFSPYKDNEFRFSYDMTEFTCMPVGSEELFSRRTAGPYLVIYKIK